MCSTVVVLPRLSPVHPSGAQGNYHAVVTLSRAALRKIEPGSDARCVVCGTPIKFSAREAGLQVIANVYAEDVWQRVEYFHEACYAEAGSPHGAVTAVQFKRP